MGASAQRTRKQGIPTSNDISATLYDDVGQGPKNQYERRRVLEGGKFTAVASQQIACFHDASSDGGEEEKNWKKGWTAGLMWSAEDEDQSGESS